MIRVALVPGVPCPRRTCLSCVVKEWVEMCFFSKVESSGCLLHEGVLYYARLSLAEDARSDNNKHVCVSVIRTMQRDGR